MCTALCIKNAKNNCFFGRNMDLHYNFNQSVMVIPKHYLWEHSKNNIIGMGTLINSHPMLADGMNDKGLACAGLNFPGNAYYEKNPQKGKILIPPYDFIPWVLFNFDNTDEVKKAIAEIELTDKSFNDSTPLPTLHWIISDKTGNSITVEKTRDSFKVYDNPVNVLTNNPAFDKQLENLDKYQSVSPASSELGSGTTDLPGGVDSKSRFVRISYLQKYLPTLENDEKAVSHFFHMLDFVKMPLGSVKNSEGENAFTIYSSCMDLNKGIYYFKTYENNRINAVDIKKEISNEIKLFKYPEKQDINYLN